MPMCDVIDSFYDTSVGSFHNFINQIEAFEKPGTIPIKLELNKETAIVGFAKKADKLDFIFKLDYSRDYILRMKKPDSCKNGMTCICLCLNIDSDISAKIVLPNQIDIEYDCKEAICYNYNFEIPTNYEQCSSEKDDKCISSVEGGFIFTRDLYLGPTYDSGGPGFRAIYLEKYKNFIGVCENIHCLTEELKKEIDKNQKNTLQTENKEKAITEFNRFIEFFIECENKKNQNCGSFNLNLPTDYCLFYLNSIDKKGFYLAKGSPSNILSDTETIKYQGYQLNKDDNIEQESGCFNPTTFKNNGYRVIMY